MKGQNCDRPVRRMAHVLSAAAVFLGIMVLAGCSGTEDDPITINSAAAIAQESNANYNDNTNGLISGVTMMSWLDDWPANRPAGITGKLVILQTGNGAMGQAEGQGAGSREYLRHDDINVFTYRVPNDAWAQTRSTGVAYVISMVADGKQMDALLKSYNIDPTRDMIVFVMAYGGYGQNMIIGRAWYMFRYWGIDKKHLGILNGGINVDAVIDNTGLTSHNNYFVPTPSTPPKNGTFTIDQIRVDNTALQASLQEMMVVAKAEGANVNQTTVPAGGAFILDARGNTTTEYSGGPNATSGAVANSVAFEGHIAGAVPGPSGYGFDYRTLLDSANGYRYLDKTTIEGLIMAENYEAGSTVYTYCRTSYRAMVTGIATGVILGYPTKIYDGAWIEWGQLALAANNANDSNLPEGSPWRTDLASVSTPINYNTPSTVESLEPDWLIDAYAASANALINEDKGYKWGATDDGGGGGPPTGGGGGGCGG